MELKHKKRRGVSSKMQLLIVPYGIETITEELLLIPAQRVSAFRPCRF